MSPDCRVNYFTSQGREHSQLVSLPRLMLAHGFSELANRAPTDLPATRPWTSFKICEFIVGIYLDSQALRYSVALAMCSAFLLALCGACHGILDFHWTLLGTYISQDLANKIAAILENYFNSHEVLKEIRALTMS